jgi:hypothetical protein
MHVPGAGRVFIDRAEASGSGILCRATTARWDPVPGAGRVPVDRAEASGGEIVCRAGICCARDASARRAGRVGVAGGGILCRARDASLLTARRLLAARSCAGRESAAHGTLRHGARDALEWQAAGSCARRWRLLAAGFGRL